MSITRYTVSGPGTLTESPDGEYIKADADFEAALQMAGFTHFLHNTLGETGGCVRFAIPGQAQVVVGNPLLQLAEEIIRELIDNPGNVNARLVARQFLDRDRAADFGPLPDIEAPQVSNLILPS